MKKIIALALVMIISAFSVTAAFADEPVPAQEEEVAAVSSVEDAEIVVEGEEEEVTNAPSFVPTFYSGSCGTDAKWFLNVDEGTLEISGSGEMTAYASESEVPWNKYAESIEMVQVADGIASVSSYAFAGCANLLNVFLPESVTEIGNNIFDGVYKNTLVVYYAGTKDKWEKDVKKTASDYEDVTVICSGEVYKEGFYFVDNQWRFYADNEFDSTANGLIFGSIDGEYGYWYCKNGICSLTFTDVSYTTKEDEKAWWNIKNSKLVEADDVAYNSNGWWYCEGGKVNFDFKGIASNSSGDWYCESGKVNFGVTDVLQATFAGETAWWNIKGGAIDYSTVVAHNAYGWWYCENGKVDFTYIGIAPNSNGWWRIVDGKVDFSCNSIEENEFGWWKIEGGKVNFNYTGVAQNAYGWWYCEGGKVNFGYNGVGGNANGWWKCKNGKVDFTYTGFASNSNGEWYCENGKVNFYKTAWIDGKPVLDGKVSANDLRFQMALKAQSYASDTKYLILIDCYNNRLGIFEGSKGQWKYRNNGFILCATGAGGDLSTIKGEFKLTYNRGYSFSGPDDGVPDYTCYYYSGFSGHYLIHSILYHYNTWSVKDGTLGTDVSHGCVRVATEEAKWIYDNCPVGTTVITYK